MPVFQVVAPWHINFTLSFFETQHQLTHPPVKSLTLPHRKMPVFQSITPWRISFSLSCVIFLWDSVPVHSPFGKELNSSSQEYARFSVSSSRHNVFISPYADSLWFNIHPYYSLILYSLISRARDRRYSKYIILYMVYFYCERPPLWKEKGYRLRIVDRA